MSNTFAEVLCNKVNHHGLGTWLSRFAEYLSIPEGALMPVPAVSRHVAILPGLGLQLVLSHPHAGNVEVGDPDRWVLHEAHFGMAGQFDANWQLPLPFGLDPDHATPKDAMALLGADHTYMSEEALKRGDRRQSYFLDQGIVIGLVWRESLVGIESLVLTRLGATLDSSMQAPSESPYINS